MVNSVIWEHNLRRYETL